MSSTGARSAGACALSWFNADHLTQRDQHTSAATECCLDCLHEVAADLDEAQLADRFVRGADHHPAGRLPAAGSGQDDFGQVLGDEVLPADHDETGQHPLQPPDLAAQPRCLKSDSPPSQLPQALIQANRAEAQTNPPFRWLLQHTQPVGGRLGVRSVLGQGSLADRSNSSRFHAAH